jgi:hypothetical protein
MVRHPILPLILGSLILLNLGTTSASAFNDGAIRPPPTASGTVNEGSPEAIVVSGPGGSQEIHRPGGGHHGTWTCHYYGVFGTTMPFGVDILGGPITPLAGAPTYFECRDGTGATSVTRFLIFDPADPMAGLDAPERAADQARKLLSLSLPAIQLSPPLGVAQLVGVPTWLWLGDPWAPMRASATLDGVTATVTARPTAVTWDLGDGTVIRCDGPGTPYDTSRSADDQRTTCSHTFETRGRFALTATVAYDTTWTATTGDGGLLGPVARTSTVTVTVEEAQAVIH